MGLISRVSSRTYRESHFFFCKMAMIRTSALRFAIRTSAIRQNPDIKNPFDLNRTGEFHDKYKAEHGEKFRYAYIDCGPSIAPWMDLPTESKPNPFGDNNDPRMFEMYPRQNEGSLSYFGALFNHQRQAQSRGGRAYGNIILALALVLSFKFAAIGAASNLGHVRDHHEEHRQEVIEAARRW